LDTTLHLFYRQRHPSEMGAAEVKAFLTHLAMVRNLAASTQVRVCLMEVMRLG